jgi:uncharacterized protein YeeX (DUF496 family)
MQEQSKQRNLQQHDLLELCQRLVNATHILERKLHNLLIAAVFQRVELLQNLKQHVMQGWKLKAVKPIHKQSSYELNDWVLKGWKC